MKARWEDLVMVNYRVDKEWAERFVPTGCELDLYEGNAYVSVVAFKFCKTKIMGIPMPLYREFNEINLRIYVKKKINSTEKTDRGVVFIKEIIPHKLPALVANMVFKENFHVMPVIASCDDEMVSYAWGEGNFVDAKFSTELGAWDVGSEEEFIGDNFFAYKEMPKNKTLVFEIEHRNWKLRNLKEVKINIDLEALYGEDWAKAIEPEPTSVFYLDGSEVGVTLPKTLT